MRCFGLSRSGINAKLSDGNELMLVWNGVLLGGGGSEPVRSGEVALEETR